MESNQGRQDAARTHLRLLPIEAARQQDHYVALAASYGLEVFDIVEASGLTVERVRGILDRD